MKGGDYMIHVYVQGGKQFKLPGEKECSPFVEIQSCGYKKFTQTIDTPCDSSREVKWKEHLFIEPKNIHKNDISSSNVQISVKNKGFFKDELIGYYEFDIQTIYFSNDKHTLQHQWIALSNPSSSDFTEISGVLLVSIAIQAEGDPLQILEDVNEEILKNETVLIPPTIKKEFKQLKIRFIQAEKLPNLDMLGTIDLFYQLEFGGKRWKSNVVTMKDDICSHNYEFYIPLSWPLQCDRLVIQLFDEDLGKANEIVGSLFFSLAKLVGKGANGGFYSWYNVYGAPLGVSGEQTDLMNQNPEFASTWKGRVLLHISCENSLQPEALCQEMKTEEKIRDGAVALGFLKVRQYQMIAEVESGIQLPANNTNYTVKIQVGDFEMQTKPATICQGNFNQWLWRSDPQGVIFSSKFQNLAMIKHIYVYLMQDTKAVSFWQGDISQFEFLNAKTHWLVLRADRALGIVNEDVHAGMVSVKISINDISLNGVKDFQKYPSWAKKIARRMNVTNLRLFIFQAKNIPAADDNGLTDCYIKVWNYEGKKLQTEVVNETLNPIFYQAFDIAHQYQTLDEAPPIILNIWDQKPALQNDKFLGRCLIYLDQASSNPRKGAEYDTSREAVNLIPVPKWHDIRRGNDDQSPVCGQVLCSIVVASDEPFKIPDASRVRLIKSVKTKIYNAQINILGLRELESFGILPIRKPFVRFNIKSMLPPEKAIAVSDINTDPAVGANPNFNTIITFSASLPVEDIYCPALTCDVFDHIFLGLRQPIIGTFTIPIGQIKSKCDEYYQLGTRTGKQLLTMLEDHFALSVEDMQKQAQERLDKIINPETKKKLEERKKYLDSEREAESLKMNFSKTKTQIVGKDTTLDEQKLIKDYQSFVDEENPAPIKVGQIELQTIVGQSLQKRIAQIQEEQKQIDNQLLMLANSTRRSNLMTLKQKQEVTESLRVSLRKKLLKTKKDLEDQLKDEKEVERKLDQLLMKQTNEGTEYIKIPNYAKSKQMENIFTEVEQPPSSLYMKIGYNDLPRIVKMMEGNDLEKREAFLRAAQTTNLEKREKFMKEHEVKDLKRRTERTKMHYRRYYLSELENCPQFKQEIFDRIEIFRGQRPSVKRSFLKLLTKNKPNNGRADDKMKVGIFKGMIEIWNEDDRQQNAREIKLCKENIIKVVSQIYQKVHGGPMPFQIAEIHKSSSHQKLWDILRKCYIDTDTIKTYLQQLTSREEIQNQLEQPSRCEIHLYLLEGHDLVSKDIGSESDPYVVVTCGDRSYNNRQEYQLNERNPKFNLHYRFQSDFPGAPSLKIEAFDYDDLFGDDLIGITYIDLDDRFYNPKWRALKDKPIEFRQLNHHSSNLSQGQISCWVDINQHQGKSDMFKEWELETEPNRNYQVRLCVMDTQDIPKMDFEGTSDIYIKAYINYKEQFQTDTHYRCMNGKGSFNYRMLFDIQSPRQETQLVLQAYDRDLFSKNDYICEWVIDLREAFNFVNLTQMVVHVNEKYLDGAPDNDPFRSKNIQFLKDGSGCFIVETNGPDGTKPKIRLDLRILPELFAKRCPAGTARNEPNLDPVLLPPVGRIQWTLDPCKMLNQLMDKKTQMKILCSLIWVGICVLLILMIPMVTSNFFSEFIIWVVTGTSRKS